MKGFAGSVLVVIVVIVSAALYNFVGGIKWNQRSSIPFKVEGLEPQTPQDYILLGQKIDINTASAPVLEVLPGIGPSLASKIIKYREEHGRFASLDELDSVNGIGPKTLEKLKGYLK